MQRFEVHNLSARTESFVADRAAASEAVLLCLGLARAHPSNRYAVFKAEMKSGRHGPFISVTGEGLCGPAEYSARVGAPKGRQMSEAISYTVRQIVQQKGN